MIYLFDDTSTSLKILNHFFHSGSFAKTHLEADAFFGNDKMEPPYFQVTFYSVPALPSFVHEFPKMENLNPKVIIPVHTHFRLQVYC